MPTRSNSRILRFFFMRLGTLVSIIVYFRVYDVSGYSADGLRSALFWALLVQTIYMAVAYWRGEHKQFDVALWLLWAVGTVAVVLDIAPVVFLYRVYSGALLFTSLGLAACLPMLLGREPFTYYYGRRELPGWQLRTAEFHRVSRVAAGYWAVLFFVAAASCVHAPTDPLWTFLLPNALIVGLGLTSSRWLAPLYFKLFPPTPPARAEPLIMGMPMVFQAAAAQDVRASIQFHVRGPEPGSYWIRVGGGKCESFEGATMSPDVTIRTPGDVWVRIARGELDAGSALAEGLYQVEGDPTVFMRMSGWFGAASQAFTRP